MKIDRLLSIIVLLLTKDKILAKDLARRFEVSIRTIYRDMETINQAGIPIISYQGFDGGYGVMKNFSIDRQHFTQSDLAAIHGALKGINAGFSDPRMDRAAEKIKSLIPRTEHTEEVLIDTLPWGIPDSYREQLQMIRTAVSERRVMQFTYRDMEKRSSERRIEPMTLIFKGYAWYLFGYCRGRKDHRLFRLSRMRSISVLQERFERRSATYDAAQFTSGTQPMAVITMRFDSIHRERILDQFPDIPIRDERTSFTADITLPEGAWIDSFILSFGASAEVLSPPHIRERIRTIAEAVAHKNKPDIPLSQH